MTENQKLREAFEAYITDNGKWPNAILKAPGGQYLLLRTSVAWQDWKACAEALALPTAEQVDDINVAESFTSVTKTAAPVGERDRFEDLIEEFEAAAIDKHDCRNPEYEFEHRAYDSACQRYDEARSALSAGDAVDAQRYRWLRDEAWAGYNQGKGFPHVFTIDGAGNRRTMLAEDALDASIDAAMRKGQL